MSEAISQEVPTAAGRPLCVDLDGTLVKSDTLYDSVVVLARRKPYLLWRLPLWLLEGKARLKQRVGAVVQLDVARLPYNRELLDYLRSESKQGRRIYLATGADGDLARRIAAHLGIFEGVLASDGATNLTGENKLKQLQRLGPGGFDYVGNAVPDGVLLAHATEAMVANPDSALSSLLRVRKVAIGRRFEDRAPRRRALARAMRLHQWAKNVLVFLPLLLAHKLDARSWLQTAAAFFCFSFCASANYIVNDLLDLEADRHHSQKRFRPFAAGDLAVLTGLLLVVLFLAAALVGVLLLPARFTLWLGIYFVATLSYSLYLKRFAIVDVLILSGLYTLRMLAGAAASDTPISHWLASFSIFLFLSLAMVKRFSELENLRARGGVPANGRGYLLADVEQLRSFGTASAYAAVVVFSLYISGIDQTGLYRHGARMWLVVPLMLLWLSRIWLLASRGELDEDPVIFALSDRMSILIGMAVVLVALAAL